MPHLELFLLGSFHVKLNGQPLTGLKTDKARALLVYLAVERRHAHRRQVLAGLLWLDFPESGARENLRHALSNLRQVLGDEHYPDPFLLVGGDTLQFNPESDFWLDVAEFERLAASSGSDLESAVELYRGGFLAGFTLKDSPDFDRWTAILRERYQGLVSTALGKLADQFEQSKAYEKAINYTRQRLELEPWQEDAHRQLMHLLALSGQRPVALAQFEACKRSLKDELGVEPSVETIRLYESIRDGKLSIPATAREAPLAQLPRPAH
jgi:DNA-binding SARP family transcriptional activator